MIKKFRKAFQNGKRYEYLNQENDLAGQVGTLSGDSSYKDYHERKIGRGKIETNAKSYNFIESFLFRLGEKEGKKDQTKWKDIGSRRKDNLNSIMQNGLKEDIEKWFMNASEGYLNGSRDKGVYGGNIKDWAVGLTASGHIEASVDYRVENKDFAESDLIKIFLKHQMERVIFKHSDLKQPSLYYFRKKNKEN